MSTSQYLFHYDGSTYTNRRQSPHKMISPKKDNYQAQESNDEYNPQYQYLKKWFESRVRGISEDIRSAFKLVQSDALIDTMRQDSASEEFVHQRVKEIIEDCLANDREALLEKIVIQYNHLKNEYEKLDTQHQKAVFEMRSRIEDLQEQYRNEVKNRELFENEVQALKATIQNLTKNYEGALHNSQVTLEKEIDIQRIRNKEIESELNKAHQVIEDLRRSEHELKKVVNDLEEESGRLRAQKKEAENKFRRITEDMSSEYEQNTEKLQRAHKEKVDQYKKKLLEYKERVSEKEDESRVLQRRADEEQVKLSKKIEILETRLQDQIDSSEQASRILEEENYNRLGEMRDQYESQLREVQDQLKGLLDQKVYQLQEDAEDRINQIKTQERELQSLLEEKMLEIERDYVRLDYHEKVVEEKNQLLEKYKEDLNRKEQEYRQEVVNKLKNLEERLTEEHNARQKAVKGIATISELEQQIKDLNETVKHYEHESKLWTGERQALNESLEQFEYQKRQSHESIEEWASKCKKLKVACDEEQSRRNELEREIRNQQERNREIKNKLDETLKEVEDRNQEIHNIHQEGLNLENLLKQENAERKRLEKEFGIVNRDLLETKDNLQLLQDDSRILKDDCDRLNATLKAETEKYDKEVVDHSKNKAKLKKAEENIEEMRTELDEKEDHIDQLSSRLEQQEKYNRQLASKNEESRDKLEELYKEKLACERRVDQVLIKAANFRRNTVVKLDSLRAELMEARSISIANTETANRLFKSKLSELLDRFDFAMQQKEQEHEYEIEALKARLNGEFTRNFESLKTEYYRMNLERQEEYDERFNEQAKQLEYKEEANRKLTEKLNELGKDLERRDVKQSQLKSEFLELKREKEEIVLQLEQANQTFIKDLESAQEELKKAYEDTAQEKKSLEEKYSRESSQLKREIEKLKDNHGDVVRRHEMQVRELERGKEDEIFNLRKYYEDTINQLEIAAKTAKGTEDMLIDKVNRLDNKILKLKKKVEELEKENKDLKEMYEKKLETFETRMIEVNKLVERENEETNMFREEKINELDQSLKTIHMLQMELKSKNEKIAGLMSERNRMDHHFRDAESELSTRLNYMDKQKHDLIEKNMYQSREIEQFHQLLSKAYKLGDEKLSDTRKKDIQEDNLTPSRSIHYRPKKDYIKIEKRYDPHEASSHSNRANASKEKSRSMYYDQFEPQLHSTGGGESKRKKNY